MTMVWNVRMALARVVDATQVEVGQHLGHASGQYAGLDTADSRGVALDVLGHVLERQLGLVAQFPKLLAEQLGTQRRTSPSVHVRPSRQLCAVSLPPTSGISLHLKKPTGAILRQAVRACHATAIGEDNEQ